MTDFFFPDPTVWSDSKGRYLALSTGLRRMLVSDDLLSWRNSGRKIMDAQTFAIVTTNSAHLWAPDVAKVRDKWILTFTQHRSFRDCRIYSLVSDTPEGPYRDPVVLTDSLKTHIGDTIDPEIVCDRGRTYLFFGSLDGIHYLELTPDARSPLPGATPVHVAGRKAGYDSKNLQRSRYNHFEGTYIHKRGNWWYLFASGGRYADASYRIVVGRSRKITGPYVDREGRPMTQGNATTIMMSKDGDRFCGPGHNGEIIQKYGKEWMFFHVHDRTLATDGSVGPRVMMMHEIRWDDYGWPYFPRSQ